MAGCAVIAALVLASWEVVVPALTSHVESPGWRAAYIGRAVLTSVLLAAYAGWFVLRSRKRIEAERERLRALEMALAERTRRAEQTAGLGALTRTLAHEIRNPLHAMGLNCALLKRAVPNVPEPQAEAVNHVSMMLQREIERLDKLVDTYLRGKATVEVDREPLHLARLAEEVVDLHAAALAAKEISVLVLGHRDPRPVVADPGKMRQLLHNLLRNAMEALPQGGRVTIHCGMEDGQAVLRVEDDGPGFEDPDAVFRPFYTTKRTGTGLGLAIVRDIARAHGGSVSASNLASGGGACVTVRLPAGLDA